MEARSQPHTSTILPTRNPAPAGNRTMFFQFITNHSQTEWGIPAFWNCFHVRKYYINRAAKLVLWFDEAIIRLRVTRIAIYWTLSVKCAAPQTSWFTAWGGCDGVKRACWGPAAEVLQSRSDIQLFLSRPTPHLILYRPLQYISRLRKRILNTRPPAACKSDTPSGLFCITEGNCRSTFCPGLGFRNPFSFG
jgi:hypothetical protein